MTGAQGDGDSYVRLDQRGRPVRGVLLGRHQPGHRGHQRRDRRLRARPRDGPTTRVSVDSAGTQGDGDSSDPSISADGRYVAFDSLATNLVAGDTNAFSDVFVRDRQTGTTTRVSVDSDRGPGGWRQLRSLDQRGRPVRGVQVARQQPGPGGHQRRVRRFVHDRQTGLTTRVSVDSSGIQGDGDSFSPSISGNGRYVALKSTAANLVPEDTNGVTDVFVRQLRSAIPNDFDGDGRGHRGMASLLRDLVHHPFFQWRTNADAMGPAGDNVAPGDYDGDGKTDIAVWRPSSGTWYIINSSNGEIDADVMGPFRRRDGARGLRRGREDGYGGMASLLRDLVRHPFFHRWSDADAMGPIRRRAGARGLRWGREDGLSRCGVPPPGPGTSSILPRMQ